MRKKTYLTFLLVIVTMQNPNTARPSAHCPSRLRAGSSNREHWRLSETYLHTIHDQKVAYVKGKGVCVYSPDIPVGLADFTLITPQYWNSLLHSLISLGSIQRIFCSCSQSHRTNIRSTWCPLCWADKGSLDSKLAQGCYT